jgi:hypothetical protein
MESSAAQVNGRRPLGSLLQLGIEPTWKLLREIDA